MIYLATIILSLSSESMDDRLVWDNFNSTVSDIEMVRIFSLVLVSSLFPFFPFLLGRSFFDPISVSLESFDEFIGSRFTGIVRWSEGIMF